MSKVILEQQIDSRDIICPYCHASWDYNLSVWDDESIWCHECDRSFDV